MRGVFCSTAVVALATVPHLALAQAASEAPSSSAVAAIEEVVVTAQRREQQISTVPISISVVSAQTLQDVGAKVGLGDPERTLGGYGRASVEAPDAFRLEAAATGPVVGDTLFIRASVEGAGLGHQPDD